VHGRQELLGKEFLSAHKSSLGLSNRQNNKAPTTSDDGAFSFASLTPTMHSVGDSIDQMALLPLRALLGSVVDDMVVIEDNARSPVNPLSLRKSLCRTSSVRISTFSSPRKRNKSFPSKEYNWSPVKAPKTPMDLMRWHHLQDSLPKVGSVVRNQSHFFQKHSPRRVHSYRRQPTPCCPPLPITN